MAKPQRVHRLSEQIRTVIATELQRLADPCFDLITITATKVSSDMRYAKIYWSVLGKASRKHEVKAALEQAKALLRRSMAPKLGLRIVPEITFIYDDTLDVIEETQRLFQRVHEKDSKKQTS